MGVGVSHQQVFDEVPGDVAGGQDQIVPNAEIGLLKSGNINTEVSRQHTQRMGSPKRILMKNMPAPFPSEIMKRGFQPISASKRVTLSVCIDIQNRFG